MIQWRIESYRNETFMITTPDGSASFVLSRCGILKLGSGCIQAGLGELGDGQEGLIDCDEFVYVPYDLEGGVIADRSQGNHTVTAHLALGQHKAQ